MTIDRLGPRNWKVVVRQTRFGRWRWMIVGRGAGRFETPYASFRSFRSEADALAAAERKVRRIEGKRRPETTHEIKAAS